jgi:polysaccharide export outer membrane protein
MNVRVFVVFIAGALTACGAVAQEAPPQVTPPQTAAAAAAPAASGDAAASAASSAAGAAPATATRAAAATEAGDFKIGLGDVIEVHVWKNEDLSRVVTVRPDGFVTLPLVYDIRAAGLTTNELRTQITERIAAFVPAAEVSVIVREINSFKVSITGAVRMPGRYAVASSETVLDLIARAQGLTEFAKRDRIVVHRRSGERTVQMQFNYDRVSEGSDPNFTVENGDIIVVP